MRGVRSQYFSADLLYYGAIKLAAAVGGRLKKSVYMVWKSKLE
jgi:hypothetical protein